MAKKNYLDFIPVLNPAYTWDSKQGHVTVRMENKGFFNRVAQVLFKRPKVSYIDLDEYGSFIWRQINGKASIYDIAQAMKQQFGKDAEPLIERLVKYFHILDKGQFIYYQKG